MVQDPKRFNIGNPDSKKNILVIAAGNEFRGDDGVGPFVARMLKAKKMPGVLVEVHSGEATSMMELWADSAAVILLDAVKSGARPGRIYRLNPSRQSIPRSFFGSSTHNFGLAEAVGLAKKLKRLPPYLIIYGIEGKIFSHGRGLSPEVKRAAPRLMERVIGEIREKTESVPA